MSFRIEDVDRILFDFDGVLTDNKVFVDQNGMESVVCSRADGLAFDVLKKMNVEISIFSTETNPVVAERAKKLGVNVIQSISDKRVSLTTLAEEFNWNLSRTVYVGNDLNDFHAMKLCGITFCPSDAHEEIKKISTKVLQEKGGNGVVRELLESVYRINFLNVIEG